ncbi:P-type conjugative transfer protein TrbJ [Brevundimonas sp. DS20]|uniref:P-type conjugative transfer protein TrbJ n=1 Tax=Brevundimonas TaxID=41275 RepID=UPI0006D0C5CC|nr:P-type conjugative transfer protein TrbJ [Brevundimonas sp. DS20]ALJ06938.1 conjugal transfer protein TrbJ [Brevundimonas sp. DS20]
MKTRSLSRVLLAGCAALSLALTTTAPATAQVTVWDPTNHVQNVLQAARALEQINNQIASLQNEATALTNQARNLASLPHSSLATLQSQIQRTQQLLNEAQRIAYDVGSIDDALTRGGYANASMTASNRDLLDSARERWSNSVAAFEDALRVQAGVVGNLDDTRAEMSTLVTASQSATGALQAAQAGNQILALQSQQIADLTAVVAAQGRAQTLEDARGAASSEQAREQLRRFLAPGRGYQPGDVRMFPQ